MKERKDDIDSDFIFELENGNITLPATGWCREKVLHIVGCKTAVRVHYGLWWSCFTTFSSRHPTIRYEIIYQ